MKKLMTLALMLVPVLALAVPTEKSGMKEGLPYFEATESLTQQGTVLAINTKAREVTVLIAPGDTLILVCGVEIKNFPQIVKGDVVKAKYTEKLTVHVEKTGSPTITTESSSTEAKLGEKPSATQTDKLRFSATITSINKAAGTVTLKGYRGNSYVLTPRKPENLSKVAVGQLVVFTYEEAVAASVVKVTPPKKTTTTAK